MATWRVVIMVEDSDISDPPAWVHDQHICQECGEVMLPKKVVEHLRKINRFLLSCSCVSESAPTDDGTDADEAALFMQNRKIPYLENPVQPKVGKLIDA